MADVMRVAMIVEGQPDAEVIVAMTEMLALADGPQWLREHLQDFGSLEALLSFVRPALTWPRLPQRANELRIRIRRRGDGAFMAELRKALAVLERDFPESPLVVHRDHDSVSSVEAERARETCDGLGAILALPVPATEAWVLQARSIAVPASTKDAKDAVGRAGLSGLEEAAAAIRGSRPESYDEAHGGAALIVALRGLLRQITGG